MRARLSLPFSSDQLSHGSRLSARVMARRHGLEHQVGECRVEGGVGAVGRCRTQELRGVRAGQLPQLREGDAALHPRRKLQLNERRLLCRSVGSAEELGSAELRLEQRGGSTGASAIERRRASTASRDPGAEAGGAGGGGGGEADRPSAEGASKDTRSPGDGARAGTGLAAGGSGEGGGGCGTEAESIGPWRGL